MDDMDMDDLDFGMPSVQDMVMFGEESSLSAASLPEPEQPAAGVDRVPDGEMLRIMEKAKDLRDGQCFVLSVESGPFNRCRGHGSKRKLVQSYVCRVVDNACSEPYLRRQAVEDDSGNCGIFPSMVSQFLASRKNISIPAMLFGKSGRLTRRPAVTLETDYAYLPRTSFDHHVVEVGHGAIFSVDEERTGVGYGRVINICVRKDDGAYIRLKATSCYPPAQRLSMEVIWLYRKEDLERVGEQIGRADLTELARCMTGYQVLEGRLGAVDEDDDHMVPLTRFLRKLYVHSHELFDTSMCDTGVDVQVVGALHLSRSWATATLHNVDLGPHERMLEHVTDECMWGLRGNGFERDICSLRTAIQAFVSSKAKAVNARTLQWVLCRHFRLEALALALRSHGLLREGGIEYSFNQGMHVVELPDIHSLETILALPLAETHLGDNNGTLLLCQPQGRVAMRMDMAQPGHLLTCFERVVRLHPHGLGSNIDTDNNPRRARRMFTTTPLHAARVLD